MGKKYVCKGNIGVILVLCFLLTFSIGVLWFQIGSKLLSSRHHETFSDAERMKMPGPDSPVISMTTIPTRIQDIEWVIKSLVDQEVPAHIVLNIPMKSKRMNTSYTIPEFLKKYPSLRVNRCKVDYGPSTKLIPTLELYKDQPDKIIIVVDDDVGHSPNLVKGYVETEKKYPNSALTMRGIDRTHTKVTALGIVDFEEGNKVDVMTGVASYMIKPRFFDVPELADYGKLDKETAKEAFFHDDVWISGHLARRKVDRQMVIFNNPWIHHGTYHKKDPNDSLNLLQISNGNITNHFAEDW